MIKLFDVRMDDLPPDYKDVAETIGLEPALKLVQARGGEGVYVPKVEKICRQARDRAIRSEFNGCNHKDLARKYNLTTVWVRQILAGKSGPGNKSNAGSDGQISLF